MMIPLTLTLSPEGRGNRSAYSFRSPPWERGRQFLPLPSGERELFGVLISLSPLGKGRAVSPSPLRGEGTVRRTHFALPLGRGGQFLPLPGGEREPFGVLISLSPWEGAGSFSLSPEGRGNRSAYSFRSPPWERGRQFLPLPSGERGGVRGKVTVPD